MNTINNQNSENLQMIDVLIAEDEEKESIRYKRILEESGCYSVTIATNIEEIYECIGSYKYDVLSLDLKFKSRYSGLDILTQIKNNVPYTKVVVVTGFPKMMNEASERGADYFVKKPILLSSSNNYSRHIRDAAWSSLKEQFTMCLPKILIRDQFSTIEDKKNLLRTNNLEDSFLSILKEYDYDNYYTITPIHNKCKALGESLGPILRDVLLEEFKTRTLCADIVPKPMINRKCNIVMSLILSQSSVNIKEVLEIENLCEGTTLNIEIGSNAIEEGVLEKNVYIPLLEDSEEIKFGITPIKCGKQKINIKIWEKTKMIGFYVVDIEVK